jgi:heptosyltransferase II
MVVQGAGRMKILIIGPSWVGDMVMAQSLFIALKNNHPSCEIHVLAPRWCKDLLNHMPEVSHAIEMTVGHGEFGLGKRRALGKKLKDEKYDQAIVLPNSFKSALIPWFADIPKRTGWRGEARSWLLNDCRELDKQAYPLMVERFIALASPAGSPLPDPLPRPSLVASTSSIASLLDTLSLNNSKPVLVLCPGAEFGEAKKWPAQGYADVASQWLLHSNQEQGQVWILGSAKDSIDAQTIIKSVRQSVLQKNPEANPGDCVDLTGKTSLADAIDLMSCADRVISNDSGLMHIAAALARPLVVIYGSTSPAFTPPLTDNVKIVSLDLECSPCFKRNCPLGHTNCLKQLPPERINQSLQELS